MYQNYNGDCNDRSLTKLPQSVRIIVTLSLYLHSLITHEAQRVGFAFPFSPIEGQSYTLPCFRPFKSLDIQPDVWEGLSASLRLLERAYSTGETKWAGRMRLIVPCTACS